MRRVTLGLIVSLAWTIGVGPLAAGAPPAGRLLRLGHVWPGSPGAYTTSLNGLRQGLRELGYVEGRHVVIEERYAEGQMARLPELFAELIRLKVDLLVAPGTVMARAAQQATTTLPIVAVMGDPVGTGLAESLARPGGNLTGMSTLSGEGFSGTWLQLLKDAIPTLSRAVYLWNPTNPVSAANVRLLQRVAPRLGLTIHSVEVPGPDAIEPAFGAVLSGRAEALILEAEPLLVSYRTHIIQVAATHRLPVVSQHRAFVEAGGLLSYCPDFFQVWRHMATYVDKIVDGVKPGDLPIEQVAHFELVINLKAANALGLTMPPVLLFRADEVIQ